MQSVTTAFSVWESVAELQPVGVTDIANHLGISKTSAHRFLHALEDLGWIYLSDPTNSRWSLSSRVLAVSGRFVESSDVKELALEPMKELGRRTGETIHLTILDGSFVVLLHKIDSTKPVRTWSYVGGRNPAYATASGKAFLATMSDDEVTAMVGHDMQQITNNTKSSLDDLLEELRQIRLAGFAVNRGEWRTEVSATAAAVLDLSGSATASISISVPSHRMTDQLHDEHGLLVKAAAFAAAGNPWPLDN